MYAQPCCWLRLGLSHADTSGAPRACPQGATYTLPACACQDAEAVINRTLYFFQGKQLRVDGQAVAQSPAMVDLRASAAVELKNDGAEACELLMLQVLAPCVPHPGGGVRAGEGSSRSGRADGTRVCTPSSRLKNGFVRPMPFVKQMDFRPSPAVFPP
jgi:hypothetical protein